ncbi:tripartite tricarboxylate transporter TctB family protein [Phyllobacterium brassicacearum]|uniref:Tripartite tricarboxylate transporter TctB family protein n=1 Tax=Phyllobacterium brassicacearum TaxID=314235 RepID=A0A2P7BR58_9HYPH|nr:tripartite tricarboxylate transporter TctB family protein [Phyllobacterium brassicacearum]PSH68944.1 tripartite tricarboxylate transporter TctB family protein [Phyllobacterium brassicacearum]TDQ33692.1 putative tricarboxylic transport membrane protein [Phyllobacterium brassicacearum]
MTTKSDWAAPHPRLATPEAVISVGMLIASGFVLWQTLSIPVSPMYAKVGPTVFPLVTAIGLALLAVLLLVQAFRGGWQHEEEKEISQDWKSLGFVAAGLLCNVSLIRPFGFTAASVIMFVLVTHGFGSRQPLRNAFIGLLLALTAYFGFAKLLGVNIGGGLIENLLGA